MEKIIAREIFVSILEKNLLINSVTVLFSGGIGISQLKFHKIINVESNLTEIWANDQCNKKQHNLFE
jgi:hypothetical protein